MNDNNHDSVIRAFAAGEEYAFDIIFREYYGALCFFANRLLKNEDDAKDIVQDCFVKLWNRHAFIKNPTAIKSFLYSTVRNACIDNLRKKATLGKHYGQLKRIGESVEETWQEHVIEAETINHLYRLIHSLPPRMQQVFRMFYIEGKDYRSIAAELHTSPETVRKQKTVALSILRAKLLLLLLIFFQIL
jgi:RNA polymerase sigma-70 factor (family 1)